MLSTVSRFGTTPWIALAMLGVAMLVWWASLLRDGVPSILSLVPFAVPALLVVRGVLAHSPVLSGVVIGLALVVSTGRGVAFLVLGVAVIYLELKEATANRRPLSPLVVMLATSTMATLAAIAVIDMTFS